jgi:glycosyltransferase involved in cell wall biosynthesis
MSIHNDEQYLRDAVSSIIDQTYSNIEVIIVNDASTDRTAEILAHFASEDPRVTILNNKTQFGLAASLNIALAKAKGDYIARMDGDDVSHPDRIHQQVDFMEANPEVTVLGTKVTVIRPIWWESKEYSFPIYEKDRDIKVNFLRRPGIVHPTVMLRASFLREHQIQYNPAFLRSQDYELWVRLAFVHKAVFHNLQVPLLSYRVKGGDRTPNVAMQDHYKMLVHAEILNMLGSGTSKRLEYHALWAAGKLPKFNGVKIKDKKLMEHLKFLVEANNKKGVFDKVTLRRALFDDVKKELFYAYRSGKTAWELYRKSSVKKHLGIDKKNERIFKRRCMMWEAWHIARTIPIVGFILFMAVAVARPAILYQTASLKKAKL